MAPLKTDEIQNDTLNRFSKEEENHQNLEMYLQAYKVTGPSPDKMQSVSDSLRKYTHGLYGLL
ncbi:hypothetical protein [Pedobacter mendelii]|uniref:Uncharacterized protein n=1 Tax=Pedobacter mendelii TaxID=1908240 RepID=A0ABQ2BHL9_9SPHI|nr:hypothetical protein [Pedobacter mendelii]GGI24895.1 hypothetical protein GCM10008119_14940 [Pedobacter mendelii]